MVKVTVLGSRKTMCINPEVRELSTQNLINDKCLDLVQNYHTKEKSLGKSKGKEVQGAGASLPTCSYYTPHLLPIFTDSILAKPKDIEDISRTGEIFHSCPYYGSRAASVLAELVVLPYQALLHKNTREQLGIELKDNIVIIDEAHNLIDTLNSLYSVELTADKITQVESGWFFTDGLNISRRMHSYLSIELDMPPVFSQKIFNILTEFYLS